MAAADGATVALEPGDGLADGVAAADGATATVNVQVPRASSPSSSETVVHWTTYEPEPSGVAGVATICLALVGSTPPVATVPPPTSLTTRLLPLGFTRSTKVPPTTVTGWVTVALSAGVGVSSCACALARVATSGTSRKARGHRRCKAPKPESSHDVGSLQTFGATRRDRRSSRGHRSRPCRSSTSNPLPANTGPVTATSVPARSPSVGRTGSRACHRIALGRRPRGRSTLRRSLGRSSSFPLWGAIISLEQARRKFCAGFAIAGHPKRRRLRCDRGGRRPGGPRRRPRRGPDDGGLLRRDRPRVHGDLRRPAPVKAVRSSSIQQPRPTPPEP